MNNTHGPKQWYEFYPILQFLNTHDLDDDTYYGFLSPKFFEKTGVLGKDLHQLIQHHAIDANGNSVDVFLSSVGHGALAYHQNLFYQGDQAHSGLLALSQQVLDRLNVNINLTNLVTTNYSSAFCNYIVAKKSYWQAWHQLANGFYRLVEEDETEFGQALRAMTDYDGNQAAMRTFIQERFVEVILAMSPFRTMPFGRELTLFQAESRSVLALCHLFKVKYQNSSDPTDLIVYQRLRELVSFTAS
ncbi:hypothetical protein [uncultured Moraxella sp.]|uniref:hypothetical protein n=1 Tax=uncultured Moraxella sp. TaxID=263769 RepID=UPI0025EFE465|nr:hypothetical protein [uncultured Moraxella sp.]